MARSSSLPHCQVVQAKALLLAADGVAANDVARRCGPTDTSVRAWRHRFAEQGVQGVGRIDPGRGRKPRLAEGTVAAVVADTLRNRPDDGSTHWTTRLMAQRHGIGKDTVALIWRDHGLRPWNVHTFKILNDPAFEGRLAASDVDVVLVRPVNVGEDDARWVSSADRWRTAVRRLTGNPFQVLEVDETEIARRLRRPTTLWAGVVRDGVVVFGSPLDELRGRRSASAGPAVVRCPLVGWTGSAGLAVVDGAGQAGPDSEAPCRKR